MSRCKMVLCPEKMWLLSCRNSWLLMQPLSQFHRNVAYLRGLKFEASQIATQFTRQPWLLTVPIMGLHRVCNVVVRHLNGSLAVSRHFQCSTRSFEFVQDLTFFMDCWGQAVPPENVRKPLTVAALSSRVQGCQKRCWLVPLQDVASHYSAVIRFPDELEVRIALLQQNGFRVIPWRSFTPGVGSLSCTNLCNPHLSKQVSLRAVTAASESDVCKHVDMTAEGLENFRKARVLQKKTRWQQPHSST